MIPLDVITIHQWEGQSLIVILLPMALTVVLGFFLLFWKVKAVVTSMVVFLGALAGLLYIGSGFMMVTQMFIALIDATSTSSVILTVAFAMLPVVLGLAILKKIISYQPRWSTRDRVFLAIFGILGLFLWAGLLVGPFVAIIVSILAS